MATDIGKIFETQLKRVFQEIRRTHAVGLHRLTDTGAAGAIVSSQPSDYLLGITGELSYLEAKASEKHSKLPMAMIKASQRGAIRYYQGLLGIPYRIFFWDVNGSRIELWDGLEALSPSRQKSPYTTITACSFRTELDTRLVADFLIDHLDLNKITDLIEKG